MDDRAAMDDGDVNDPKLTFGIRSPRRMPIGNQRDAIAKTCRSKRAYSFLICTRTLSIPRLRRAPRGPHRVRLRRRTCIAKPHQARCHHRQDV